MTLDARAFSLFLQGIVASINLIIALAVLVMHRACGTPASRSIVMYTGVWLVVASGVFVARLAPDQAIASVGTVWAGGLTIAIGGLVPLLVYHMALELRAQPASPPRWHPVLIAPVVSLLAFALALALAFNVGWTSTTAVVGISRALNALSAAVALGTLVVTAEWRGPHRRALWYIASGLFLIALRPVIGPLLTGQSSEYPGTAFGPQLVVLGVASVVVSFIATLAYGAMLEVTQHGLRDAESWIVMAQRELRASQDAQDHGRLAAGLAHDVGNILHIVSLVASQLHTHIDAHAWGRLTSLAERGRILVQRMLDIARAAPTAVTEIDLGHRLQELVPVLARLGPRHDVVLHVEEESVMARVDPEAMERILMELVRNAAVNTPPGSRIAIFVEYVVRVVPDGLPLASAKMGTGRYACVTVEDQGRGIPRKYLPVSGARGGMGEPGEVLELGLPTYRALARSMGGDLTIERSDASGSVLRLWLQVPWAS